MKRIRSFATKRDMPSLSFPIDVLSIFRGTGSGNSPNFAWVLTNRQTRQCAECEPSCNSIILTEWSDPCVRRGKGKRGKRESFFNLFLACFIPDFSIQNFSPFPTFPFFPPYTRIYGKRLISYAFPNPARQDPRPPNLNAIFPLFQLANLGSRDDVYSNYEME